MLKVLMLPHPTQFGPKSAESGIRRVIEAYHRHLPNFGIELVSPDSKDYAVKAVHAGMTGADCDVAITHGLYWTADYNAPLWEYRTNADVIAAIRHAKEVTVPSPWVREAFQRDMRFSPHVVPHGVEWDEWQHSEEDAGYVLWNKNRIGDVCSTEALGVLASRFDQVPFLTTFAPKGDLSNVLATGLLPHDQMKKMIQRCSVYLSTTKETFGIGVLEAMAAGKPILGFSHGGTADLVKHGENGYLAPPGNYEALCEGLTYCLKHTGVLGANGREMAKRWSWGNACTQMAQVLKLAAQPEPPPTVAIIIPSFNYSGWIERSVRSAMEQTYGQLTNIVIVDDGSNDEGATEGIVKTLAESDNRVRYLRQPNSGVAVARNTGIDAVSTKYICCLDADDALQPEFLEEVMPALEADRSLGIAYSGLALIVPTKDGRLLPHRSRFPGECDFDRHAAGQCQVPTCNVFRRKVWERLGGYRQRYAPKGCGTEDAEFWLRTGAYGWGIKRVTEKALFHYTMGGRTTGDPEYEEVDWTAWHPWTKDKQFPFAAISTPDSFSHPVRQYDEPVVSVIIPVGPGHEKDVINALDSLDAQTFRKWEAIVVWDSNNRGSGSPQDFISKTYPFARMVMQSDWPSGAGTARNHGAEIARAPFLLFLDADDWLDPSALAEMLRAYSESEAETAVYTDYVGLCIISPEYAQKLTAEGRLLHFRPEDGHAVVRFYAADYSWNEAVKQPGEMRSPYIWCNISTLVPTSWHHEIGGFDESMPSWEDWDYWLRMARAGKCFTRVRQPLLVYRLYSGHRRTTASGETEESLQIALDLVQYLQKKYAGEEPVPCGGCGNKRRPSTTPSVHAGVGRPRGMGGGGNPMVNEPSGLRDQDLVMCEFLGIPTGNMSQRSVVGGHVFNQPLPGVNMVKRVRGVQEGWSISYGYHSAGERFLVHKLDVQDAPNWFRAVTVGSELDTMLPKKPTAPAPAPVPIRRVLEQAMEPEAKEVPQEAPTGAPTPIPVPQEEVMGIEESMMLQPKFFEFDPKLLPGVTPGIAKQMGDAGISSYSAILELGMDGLLKFKGVGEVRAEAILAAAQELDQAGSTKEEAMVEEVTQETEAEAEVEGEAEVAEEAEEVEETAEEEAEVEEAEEEVEEEEAEEAED